MFQVVAHVPSDFPTELKRTQGGAGTRAFHPRISSAYMYHPRQPGTFQGPAPNAPKSVRDREGSKHSTAATLERVDSEAAVLPQDFEDTMHARQLMKALCRRVGQRMSRQGPGRSPSMGLTHLNAARPREKSSGVPHCGSSKILSDLVSHRRATRLHPGMQHVQTM